MTRDREPVDVGTGAAAAPASCPYDYAVVRVVPRVEREEFVNAGVIVFARTRGYLAVRLDDRAAIDLRLRALAGALDLAAVHRHLDGLAAVCAGAADGGPIAALPPSERFHWMVTPRSSIIQCSVVHAGVCVDPAATLDRLFAQLVAR